MSGDQINVTISHERQVVTYSWLWHASRVTYDIGKSGAHGAAWQWMASAVLTAFTVEAFLNHVGTELFPDWGKTEKRESVRRKLDRLSEALGVNLGSDEQRPLSTLVELISFRNQLAHGRTEVLTATQEQVEPEDVDRQLVEGTPRTAWEIKIRSADFAERARIDVEKILSLIQEARRPEKEPLFFTGMHMSGTAGLRENA